MPANSVELLEQAIDYAKKQGFRVRTEMLENATAGFCRLGKTRYIFLDQASTAQEQLAEIMRILQSSHS